MPGKKVSYNFVPIPKDRNSQRFLGNEMLFYVNETKTIDLDEFPNSLRMSPYRFYKLAEKSEYFAESLECARYIISSRIKKGWMFKQLDSKACAELLPEYNQAYREWVRSRVVSARNELGSEGRLTVLMESIQTTTVVPERVLDGNQPSTKV